MKKVRSREIGDSEVSSLTLSVNHFLKLHELYFLMFFAIKSLISAAQEVITYHWKTNLITDVLGTTNYTIKE